MNTIGYIEVCCYKNEQKKSRKTYTQKIWCAGSRLNAGFFTYVTIEWGWITFRVKPENHYATLSDVKTADICGGAGAAMTKDPRSISRRKNLMNERVVEKILVVSENQELCLFLRSEVKKHIFDRPLKIDFCYTSSNQDPKKMVEMGATKINVKDELTIDFIVSRYDLVFSLHCKQIFPNRLVENVRCVNFHPGLNPYNRGWYPQAFSIINGLPAGATIHLMDAEVDHGDIIAQKTVSIEPSDTSYEVYRKVISAEKYLIKKIFVKLLKARIIRLRRKKMEITTASKTTERFASFN